MESYGHGQPPSFPIYKTGMVKKIKEVIAPYHVHWHAVQSIMLSLYNLGPAVLSLGLLPDHNDSGN